jgi:hypothetical protein
MDLPTALLIDDLHSQVGTKLNGQVWIYLNRHYHGGDRLWTARFD